MTADEVAGLRGHKGGTTKGPVADASTVRGWLTSVRTGRPLPLDGTGIDYLIAE